MTLLRGRIPFIVLVLSSVAVIGILADLLTGQALVRLMAQRGAEEGSDGQGEVEALYVFDVSDKRKLVGAASNVFVGRVIGKTGEKGVGGFDPEGPSEPVPDSPRTQFEVVVTENIKGDLKGPVTVSQEGGYAEYAANKDYPKAGLKKGERVRELMLFEGDPLLRPGQEVLLVTNHDEENDWYQVVGQPYGTVRLSADDQTGRRQTIGEFEDAVRNQTRDPALDREPVSPEERPYPGEQIDRTSTSPDSSTGQ